MFGGGFHFDPNGQLAEWMRETVQRTDEEGGENEKVKKQHASKEKEPTNNKKD